LAIGNPFGFEETVTEGIISSKGRPNRTDAFGDLLQTDAAINPGNSGGPLINLRGEVIGINTGDHFTHWRFAGELVLPFRQTPFAPALESLLKQGRIIRGYLGIQTRALQPGQNGTENEGVIVDQVVPGSPAAEAQLQKGDVIRKFNGHEIKNFPALRSLVAQAQLNKNVELEIVRDGKPLKVTTQIKEQPVDYQSAGVVPRRGQPQPQAPEPAERSRIAEHSA
jgi:serine protease Do